MSNIREYAPFRVARFDPQDPTRLEVHNERLGYVDKGKESGKPEKCFACGKEGGLLSTSSLHFCRCGVFFNYWAGGGNARYKLHEAGYQADQEREEARGRSIQETQDWYDSCDED